MPEGLPVPNVSSPPDLIPTWNAHNSKDIEALFEFADGFLTDDAPLLLFLPEFKRLGMMLGHMLLHMNLHWQRIGGQ